MRRGKRLTAAHVKKSKETRRASIDLRKKLQAMKRPMPYAEYLQTPWWNYVRKTKLRTGGYKCSKCGVRNTVLQVHHLHYNTLWKERGHDLRVLCVPCHEQVHQCH